MIEAPMALAYIPILALPPRRYHVVQFLPPLTFGSVQRQVPLLRCMAPRCDCRLCCSSLSYACHLLPASLPHLLCSLRPSIISQRLSPARDPAFRASVCDIGSSSTWLAYWYLLSR